MFSAEKRTVRRLKKLKREISAKNTELKILETELEQLAKNCPHPKEYLIHNGEQCGLCRSPLF